MTCAKRLLFTGIFLSIFPMAALGQNLSGISICLDPGHGPGNTNQGPTGLHEYVINMAVARYTWAYLLSAGADTVILTRTENDPNISLSQRETIANNAGVDWFHSIHHNAYNGTNRYTMVLYQELIGQNKPRWPQAYDMCMIMAPEIYRGLRTSAWYVRSDYDVRGFNFGVLNDLTMPGELSEATFHDHPVEEAKLRNPEFRKFEALAIYNSFLKYFDAGDMPYAPLGGIIYDNDSHKPIDSVRVFLSPPDTVYITDQYHNGFYGFPTLSPGTYVLTVEADGYLPETDTLETKANRFNFKDFYLISTVPPQIAQTFPADGEENTSPYGFIGIVFTRPMNPESVAAALHLEPDFPYQLQWLDNNTKLKIDPRVILDFGRTYRVTIDSTAADIYGRNLDGDGDGVAGGTFKMSFSTRPVDPQRPEILSTDPIDYTAGLFPADVVRVVLSKPLDEAILTKDNILLRGGTRRPLDIVVRQSLSPSGRAYLSILPQNFYLFHRQYVLNLTSNLKDSSGTRISQSYIFRYTTAESTPLNLSVEEALTDTSGVWENPIAAPRSSGLEADSTHITLTPEFTLRGQKGSLEIHYAFLADGLLDLPLLSVPEAFRYLQAEETVGVYVLGDSSLVRFRFLFSDSLNGLAASRWTPVDWYGWKFLHFVIGTDSLFAPSGESRTPEAPLTLAGVQIAGNSAQSGRLLLADWVVGKLPQTAVKTTGKSVRPPEEHVLVQSYPNPFSKKMGQAGISISYTIPAGMGPSEVTLAIYNMLGQKLVELVRGVQEPGAHQVFWNVLDEAQQVLPAGIYFYRLQVGNDVQTHRLVILN